MPKATALKSQKAMEIVLAEEVARGWNARAVGVWADEKKYGCDILSTPPAGGDPHRVEVKGWGEPMLRPNGTFTWGQDIRSSQYAAATAHGTYRIEIVANLDAHLRGDGLYDRLTLTAVEICARAMPHLYDIQLQGLQYRVWREGDEPAFTPPESDGPRVIDWPQPDPGPGMVGPPSEEVELPALASIASADLRPQDVPAPSATWDEIGHFARSFDGYQRFGDDECGQIANVVADYFTAKHELPMLTVDLLRGCLFFEQRRWRHFGSIPDAAATAYIRALVEGIRTAVSSELAASSHLSG